MALGTPVVAAAVEALPDVLGILVAPEDPGALGTALADVIEGRRRPDLAAGRAACAAAYRRRLAASRLPARAAA
jgi:glycosyltransferase involved in cell wall biosynthesis